MEESAPRSGGFPCPRYSRVSGRLHDGRAVDDGLGKAHGEFRVPAQHPALAERATAAARIGEPAPGDADEIEPVQQQRFREAGIRPQIHRQLGFQRLRLELQPLLLPREVGLQRHLRHVRVNRAHIVADNEPVLDQPERQRLAIAQRGETGVAHFLKAGQRQLAQGGQRLGQPRGFDNRGRGGDAAGFAQERRNARLPMRRERARGKAALPPAPKLAPEMAVPAGRGNARAIAGRDGEARVGPGRPGRGGFELGQILQQRLVLGLGHLAAQGRTCQAPQTAAMGPSVSLSASAMASRIWASRCCSRFSRAGWSGGSASSASRKAVMALSMEAKMSGACAPCSMSAFHHASLSFVAREFREISQRIAADIGRFSLGRLPGGLGAGSASSSSFSSESASASSLSLRASCAAFRAASEWLAGKSMKRTGRSRAMAQSIACHSGEYSVNG